MGFSVGLGIVVSWVMPLSFVFYGGVFGVNHGVDYCA